MTGFLLLDKPQDITSYGAVAVVKRLSGQRRVGHTGTLDPMATGVLPVLLGRATALSSYLIEGDKTYKARVRLGTVTDTCDITGNVISQSKVEVGDDDIKAVLEQFTGTQKQRPPMFSALKKDGVRLYDLARKGVEVEIPEREITVYSIKQETLLDQNNEFDITVCVSKGTYIRSLCRDIGNALGCGATLSSLTRTSASGFNIEDCVPLRELTQENIGEKIYSAERAIEHIPRITVTPAQAKRFINGGQLALDRTRIKSPQNGGLYRVGLGDTFLGIGAVDLEKNQLAVKCVIAENI